MPVEYGDIKAAAARLKGVIHRTALGYSQTFSELSGSRVYLKPENLQKTGSFKIRGAYNKISSLTPEEKGRGVTACSAGNHAQGVALAAKKSKIKAMIVMPETAPIAKVTATRNYGAEVILSGYGFDDTVARALEIQAEIGAVFVHPFDDELIIAGQGTIGLEILEELPDVDAVLVPIGGGGLISGIATAVKELKPSVRVIGVEAAGAPSMKQSLQKGRIVPLEEADSIADGITVKSPGELTFKICQQYLDRIVTVNDEEIASTILMLLERAKMVVEGAGAVALAALLHHKIDLTGLKVVPVISGGNIDINLVSRVIERGLIKAGRKVKFKTRLKNRPGNLQYLLKELAEFGANVITIEHNHYCYRDIPIDMVEVEVELETRNKQHGEIICQRLEKLGYQIEINQ